MNWFCLLKIQKNIFEIYNAYKHKLNKTDTKTDALTSRKTDPKQMYLGLQSLETKVILNRDGNKCKIVVFTDTNRSKTDVLMDTSKLSKTDAKEMY